MSSDPASPTIPPSTTQVRGAIRGRFLERVFERHTGRRIRAGMVGRGEGRGGWGRKTIGEREEKKIFGEYAGYAGENGRDLRVFEMLRWTIWA